MNKYLFQALGKKPYIPSPLLTGLVAYWKLDEASGNAADSVGSNTLTAVNAPVSAAGQVGNARAFVAASQQALRIGSPAGIAPGTSDFTVSFWIKLTGTANQVFFSWGNQVSNQPYMWFGIQGATLRIQAIDGLSGYSLLAPPTSYSTNTWHQITLTFDRDNVVTNYKNGVSQTTHSITGNQGNLTPLAGLGIGNYSTSNGAPVDGAMDEVKIWHKALSGAEVLLDYNNGIAGNPLL